MKTPQYTWLLLPLLLIILLAFTIIHYQIPSFLDVFRKSRELITLFGEKDRADEIELEIEEVRNNFTSLDSLSTILDSTRHNPRQLIDLLYPYAQDAGLNLIKVESSPPFSTGNYLETAITLKGKGTYESIGKFTERIENSTQSTRIRQVVMNEADNDLVDLLMECVILSE